MGFDPRQWSSASSQPHRHSVTSNLAALLQENDALRREVQQLRRQLSQLRRERAHHSQGNRPSPPPEDNDAPSKPSVTPAQITRWTTVMAQHEHWSSLRVKGLELLVERLNRESFHADLSLQQRLDRLVPGLGSDLLTAVAKARPKPRAAVLAAFALYGIRASEWLDEAPSRVINELLNRQRADASSRRTRSDHRATDRRNERSSLDSRTLNSLQVLGLDAQASVQEIKQAHRRLVKRHHPDLGGSSDAFRRVNDAYQWLIAHSDDRSRAVGR